MRLGDDAPSEGLAAADEAELRDLLASGKKIEAIKFYRERTGLGLKEAKDAVEDLERGVS
ncbi:MAG: ribosomal protein L7/L12 [Anaerolineae bacterium]|nr:ribosomal protein L7/L12 [Anaerolineae bacterium]